jgi:hypothetical protein
MYIHLRAHDTFLAQENNMDSKQIGVLFWYTYDV